MVLKNLFSRFRGDVAEQPRTPELPIPGPPETPPSDDGRFEATGNENDRGKFRTPTLRNVALTAPYMHDGSLPTLQAVVRYYDGGGEPHDGLDRRVHPLSLGEDDVAALVAFLLALTGDTSVVLADAISPATTAPKN